GDIGGAHPFVTGLHYIRGRGRRQRGRGLPAYTRRPMSDPRAPQIFVIDDVTAKPGRGEAFLSAYLEQYAPGAERRGMTLVHRLVSPTYWLPDGSNRLLCVWSVAGPAGVWAMKHAGRQDPAVEAWWSEAARHWIASRSRSICADAGELAALADV